MSNLLQLKNNHHPDCLTTLKELYNQGLGSTVTDYVAKERELKRDCKGDAGVIIDNINTLPDSQIISYKDNTGVWCFEKEAIPQLYKSRKNPWTGKKLPTAFVQKLAKTIPVKAVPLNVAMDNAFSDKKIVIPPMFPPSNKTGFQGSTKTELAMVLYLVYKFPNVCTPIIFDKKKLDEDKKIGLHDFAMVWRVTNDGWKLNKPSLFVDAIKECDKRFVIIYLPLLAGKLTSAGKVKLPGAHANILIYDKTTKFLERFEPHGKMGSKLNKLFNIPELDQQLKKFSTKLGGEYLRPLDFCPAAGPQSLQEQEHIVKSGKTIGFCAAWSFWYVILRMTNPDYSRTQVIEMSLKSVYNSYTEYTQYIIDFGSFFEKVHGLTYSQLNDLSKKLADQN